LAAPPSVGVAVVAAGVVVGAGVAAGVLGVVVVFAGGVVVVVSPQPASIPATTAPITLVKSLRFINLFSLIN
jgi:hypothetical protein